MSSIEYPTYIQEILHDLDSWNSTPEAVLISKADFINKDVMLYNIYIDLGYIPTARAFGTPLNISKVKSLFEDSYNLSYSSMH